MTMSSSEKSPSRLIAGLTLRTGRSIQKGKNKKGGGVTSIQFLLLLLVPKSRTTVTIVGDTPPVAGVSRWLWDAVIFL